MQPKVSVVVPVYNPGEHIDDCIASVVDQTLSPEEYEVVFADDGSTDGTAARLDALAATHEQVRVTHIDHSGTPGAARNAGIEAARGRYVYFVDDDDWISRDALDRLYDYAERHEADVVIGREVGHNGKDVSKELFRKNQARTSLRARPGILVLLTPHKLFRTSFLDEHGIRFPEDKRRLEDHQFCLQAYLRTDRVAILADHACYHWRARSDATNVSSVASDQTEYYRWLRDVVALVHRDTEPGDYRDRLLAHWYRGKGLKQLGGKGVLEDATGRYRHLFDEVRSVAMECFPPSVDEHLPASMRARSALLRAGHAGALAAVARSERGVTLPVRLEHQRWEDGALVVTLRGTLSYSDGQPVRFTEQDGRMYWELPLPPDERPDISPEMREVTESLANSRLSVLVRSRETRMDFFVPTTFDLHYGDDGGATVLSVTGEARLDPRKATGGRRRLAEEAPWELIGRFTSCGWTSHRPIVRRHADPEVEMVPGRSGNTVIAPHWHADGTATLSVASARRVVPSAIAHAPELVRTESGDDELVIRLPLLAGPKGKRLADAIIVQRGGEAPIETPVSLASDGTAGLQSRIRYDRRRPRSGLRPGVWSMSARFGSRIIALGVDLRVNRSGEATVRRTGPARRALRRPTLPLASPVPQRAARAR